MVRVADRHSRYDRTRDFKLLVSRALSGVWSSAHIGPSVNIWMFRIPPFDLGDFGKLADFNSFSYGWTRIFVWVNLAHDLVLSIMREKDPHTSDTYADPV